MSGSYQNPFILHELISQISLFRNYEKEVESPSSPIRRQASNVKYPEKVERRPDKILDVRYREKVERRQDRIPDVRYPEKAERQPNKILPRVE